MTVHDFAEKLAEGQAAEQRVALYLNKVHDLGLTRAGRVAQRRGIDYHDKAGRSFELKADSVADKTGNAFIETWSVNREKPGWLWTSQADWLLYYVPPTGLLMKVGLPLLRAHVFVFAGQYPERSAQNVRYRSHGLCMPLAELEKLAERRISIPMEG